MHTYNRERQKQRGRDRDRQAGRHTHAHTYSHEPTHMHTYKKDYSDPKRGRWEGLHRQKSSSTIITKPTDISGTHFYYLLASMKIRKWGYMFHSISSLTVFIECLMCLGAIQTGV